MFDKAARRDWLLLIGFAAVTLSLPVLLDPIVAAYPAILQKFCIYGIFAIGFNILFGLTGYLSFGHAAFLGVGSYAAPVLSTLILVAAGYAPATWSLVLACGLIVAGALVATRAGGGREVVTEGGR